MGDDYTYPQKPLPVKQLLGGNTGTNVEISGGGNTPFPVSSAFSTPSPFANPDGYNPGGGGGGGDLLYITDEADLVVGSGSAGNSTTTTVTSGGTGNNLLNLTSAETGTGQAVLNLGANKIWLSVADVLADSGQVELKEINVCHMGVSGLRQFLCGDAYAP